MLVASDIRGFGLGAFQQGECADGADFVCGPKTSRGVTVNSCRPCDFPQLKEFRELQELANSLVVALGLSNTPAIITGPNECAGGDILAVDERVGPCTTRTVAKLVRVFGPRTMAPVDPLLSLANFQETNEYVAHALPEIVTYFRQLVKITSAPKNVPAPAQQPVKSVSGGPGTLPTGPSSFPSPAKRKTSGVKLTMGILAGLAAVGLVGTGVYYYRTQV